ncbi:MAG: transketolase [Promethearchaeota archaeon]
MVRLTSEDLEPAETSPGELEFLERTSLRIREATLEMIFRAKSGHPGGSLSTVDIMVALYGKVLNNRPEDPCWDGRDYFILSKGHAAPALYATLAHFKYFDERELVRLRQLGSNLQGHPKKDLVPGVEVSTGALGMGLSIGVGLALSTKLDGGKNHTFVLLGDGECQEGSVWEAAMSAAHFGLDNLTVIIDRNGLQIDGSTEKVMGLEPFAAKWEAFGFNVVEIDGTEFKQVIDALHTSKLLKGRPTVVIAYLVKGQGTNLMEHVKGFHGNPPSKEEYERVLAFLREQERLKGGGES